MLPGSRRMLLAGGRPGQPWTDSHLSWWMQVHLISIRPVYFIYPVNLNHEQNFELKLRIKLKTSESFRPQLLRWQMSCPAHNVLGFERGLKEAIYIRPKGPTLKRDGGRYNLPSAPVCGTTFFLKCRTGRGAGPGPINIILAHYAHDTTPASAYVNKTSVEVESFYQFSILFGF